MNRNIKRTLVFSAPIHSDIEGGMYLCKDISELRGSHIYTYIVVRTGTQLYIDESAHSYMYIDCSALVHSYVEVHS